MIDFGVMIGLSSLLLRTKPKVVEYSRRKDISVRLYNEIESSIITDLVLGFDYITYDHFSV